MEQNLRAKLDELLRKQAEMQDALSKLGEECQRIDRDLRKESNIETIKAAKDLSGLAETIKQDRDKIEAATPPPIPPEAVKSAQATPEQRKQEEPAAPKQIKVVSDFENYPKADPIPASGAPEKKSPLKKPAMNVGEWELNFGRVWLVRIGVLLLLTGLIFLSTYAYKNWLFNAGPAVKVTFFMTISLTLTGLGLWLENWKERFKQYGRVVASGGLAAGYYTIYASHFVPSLKLVDNTILAGLLLTLWAAVILAYAVWKKSRVVAVMAIGLAFYGTIVNPSGWLSLFSALLLSGAGVWLMMRFKWVAIGLGTMIAAYVSHAFWLGGVYPQAADESVRVTYLACYWLLFTVALTLPSIRSMPETIQRAFCALNNGAAWCLTVFLIPQFTPHAEIGWISIGVGVLWVAIAAVNRLNRMKKIWHPSLNVIFGYQGIMIASLGIMLESTGYTRFLVMAVEACILLAGARYFGGILARVASAAAFICALLAAMPDVVGGQLAPWPSYASLALVSAVYTALVRRDVKGLYDLSFMPLIPAAITWIIVILGVFEQWSYASELHGIWISATMIMLGYFLLEKYESKWTARLAGLGDLAFLSILVAIIGAWKYLIGFGSLSLYQSTLPLLGMAIFWYMSSQLIRGWEKFVGSVADSKQSKVVKTPALEWIYSLAFWIMLGNTFNHHLESTTSWMLVGGLLAISGNAIAEYTRRISIGTPALFFHLLALISLIQYGNSEPGLGWMPAALLLVHLTLADLLWNVLEKSWLRALLALGLVLTVGTHAFQEFDRPDLTLTALGLGLMAWAYHRKDHNFGAVGGLFPLAIACVSTMLIHGVQDWLRYIPIGATLMIHALLWRETRGDEKWKALRIILLGTGLLSLFITASTHVLESFDGSGLAICWALLATLLFCLGLAMRCRPYRLIGLYWLAAAVLHVVFIDVMRMETLGRILSFITLGLVLLALGFLYNRFQETIRKFL